MPQSTAGEASGAEPTYWVKWSSIWATRGSGTCRRTVPATERPMRMASTSPSIDGWKVRADVEHVADRADRPPEEEALRDLVQPLGEAQELAGSPPPRPSPGAKASSRAAIALEVGDQVERRAVLEEAPPLRVEGDEVELVVEVAAGLGEDPRRAPRGG